VVNADGTGDRKLTDRSGGSAASWSPDGHTVVFDDYRVFRTFSRRSDLRTVEVSSGKTRWLTHGVRARDPDVSPDGRSVVFVRRMGDRSELATLPLDGGEPRTLTESVPGTEWSSPRWRPQGDVLVASRLLPGGFLDLVEVDPSTGEARSLTDDRAKDVEPTWTPDGEWVVYRSDRDGSRNLYGPSAQATGRVVQVCTNVIGGAFTPAIAPDRARTVALRANYRPRAALRQCTSADPRTWSPRAREAPSSIPIRRPFAGCGGRWRGKTRSTSRCPRDAAGASWSHPSVIRGRTKRMRGGARHLAGLGPRSLSGTLVTELTAYVGAESIGASAPSPFYSNYDRFWALPWLVT
jgi:dipeptidyl aminopeptidase/acylaminoacyl peptidase